MSQYESPPVERAVRVLAFLASDPRIPQPLSAVARGAAVNKTTCLRILGTLMREGLVVERRDERSRTRCYGLGPQLIALGRAAQSSVAGLEIARPLMDQVATDLGVACTASMLLDGQIVVLERCGPPSMLDTTIQVGRRYRFSPPSGISYAVWADQSRIDAWLADGRFSSAQVDSAELALLVRSCRQRGYLVEEMSDAYVSMSALVADWDGDPPAAVLAHLEQVVRLLVKRHYVDDAIVPGGSYPVRVMTSASYDVDGQPDLLLGLLVARTLSYDEVRRFGCRLAEAADTVTEALGGNRPWDRAPTADAP